MAANEGTHRSGPNRRRFLQAIAALTPLVGSRLNGLFAQVAAEPYSQEPGHMLFVGTQTGQGSQGIYAYAWNPDEGSLKLIGLAAATPMPTFLTLAPNRKFLFAANETDTYQGAKSGAVSSFRIERPMRKAAHHDLLAPISSKATGGGGTCYVGLDRTGSVLLCANYGGGSASSFQVAPNGDISPVVSHFQYVGSGPNHDRQDAPHVHRSIVSPGNRFALFNDLGLDLIHIYKLDVGSAKLTPNNPPAWKAPAGSGPRSLQFHPNGRWAYCVTEMGNTIIVFDWDEDKGVLTQKQKVSLIPEGFKGRAQAADAIVDKSGRFLYAANRFYDGLYSYTIDQQTGELHDMARTPCAGKTPRFITLDPTEHWLLSADQDSDTIELFARDPKTGKLVGHAKTFPQVKPQCLVFI